jgi:hypothetical protein
MRPEPITVRPPFDPEAYARESESVISKDETVPPPLPPARATLPTMPAPSDVPLYTAVAGGAAVPVLTVSADDLEWFDLSPVARGMLPHITGDQSIQTISASMGMSLDEAVGVLEGLAKDGVVAFV